MISYLIFIIDESITYDRFNAVVKIIRDRNDIILTDILQIVTK